MIISKFRKQRSLHLVILFFVVQVYLLLGHVFPAFDSIPYFENKLSKLKQIRADLRVNAIHSKFYQDQINQTQSGLKKVRSEFESIKDMSNLQIYLEEITSEHNLEIVNLHFSENQVINDLQLRHFDLLLRGEYENLSEAIQSISSYSRFMSLVSCEFKNETPLLKKPVLTLKLVYEIYIISPI